MWISARTATTLAAAALLLVVVAMAAPFLPNAHLPALPEERPTAKPASKFGAAASVLDTPDRVRAQGMAEGETTVIGAARLGARVGTGPAIQPSAESVSRLLTLIRDARTVADPRAASAEPAWVVRLARGAHKVDVMADPKGDRLVVALDGALVGSYGTVALHREFAALDATLFPARP